MSEPKPFNETKDFYRWRKSVGYLYMAVCAFDFIGFPILNGIMQYYSGIFPVTQWDPITLHGAGLFHIAMGAILGISAFTKSQEVIHSNSRKRTRSYDEDEDEEPRSNKYMRESRLSRKKKDEIL